MKLEVGSSWYGVEFFDNRRGSVREHMFSTYEAALEFFENSKKLNNDCFLVHHNKISDTLYERTPIEWGMKNDNHT